MTTTTRTIEQSSQFKKDFKRVKRGGQNNDALSVTLPDLLNRLATDQPLPAAFRDHDLSGSWAGYRECHIRPDLLLIYRKTDHTGLRLARLGSHAELFA